MEYNKKIEARHKEEIEELGDFLQEQKKGITESEALSIAISWLLFKIVELQIQIEDKNT